ncbi:MAG: type VI secretion system baseplate subunit TssG [Arcobacter sp.]|nr:MAG: type VI secretion system baseplate subunit TssG [Arcobacter sp.]
MSVIELNEKIKPSVVKYSLSQGVRVAMTYLKELYPQEGPQVLYERLRFKSNPSLSFAKSELSKIEFIETAQGKNVELTLNFMGLFGASSPLPSHYCEMVLDSVHEDSVLKDFLNLFNHHIQKMIYPIWEKQRYYIQYQSGLEDKFSKYMLSFLGLYNETKVKNSKLNFTKLLPYIGILSMRQKSAGTLVSILRHYLDHDDLEIVQCIQMNEKIPSWQYSSLGDGNCSLGSNALLGKSVKTKGSKFQILLNNVSFEDCYAYSLHGNIMGELQELMDLALNEPLEHELCLEIKKEEVKPYALSQHHLGINCFLGSVNEDVKIILSH